MPPKQGDIVWATVSDEAGRNPKNRPCLIITPTESLAEGHPITAVAITSTFTTPLPDELVHLPWKRGGHPVTGLKKPCVAVCNWVVRFQVSDIQDTAGIVPPNVLRVILAKLPRP